MAKFHLKSRDHLGTPARKREFNDRLFSAIAPEYARMSRVLSFGRDPTWKRRMIGDLPAMAGPNCLDMACGDGDLSELLIARYPDASVTALDQADPMLRLARRRLAGNGGVRFLRADMAETGLRDSEFDIVTVGYGLRNAPELQRAMDEIGRLLSPGGVLAVLDFARPDNPCCAAVELALLRLWCGMWGLIRSGNADTYGYIADSLARFPARKELQDMLTARGFTITRRRTFFLGIVEAFVAKKGGE